MDARILISFCIIALNSGVSDSGSESTLETSSAKDQQNSGNELQLKNVFVTFRSHENTACDFPKGPIITGIPETESNLTKNGKDYAYNFGEYLKKNYSRSLFSRKKITKDEFYCKGTTTRRTQESAMLVAAGLVGNICKKFQPWSEKLGREYLSDKADLYTKFYNMTRCPDFYNAVAAEIPTLLKKVKKYENTVNEVEKKYDGVSMQDPASVWLAYETFSALKVEGKTENLTWLNDSMWQDLRHFAEEFIYTTESSLKAKRLSGGVMVEELLSKFEEGANSEQAKKDMRPMSLLAVPQGILGAMIGAFSPSGTKYNGLEFNPQNFYPGNGSYHVLEYYEGKTCDGKIEKKFRVLYTPYWETPPMPLIYKDCDENTGICTLAQLQTALRDIRLKAEQQDRLCKLRKEWIEMIKEILSGLFGSLFENFFGRLFSKV